MFRTKRRLSLLAINCGICLLFIVLCVFLTSGVSVVFAACTATVLFSVLLIIGNGIYGSVYNKLERNTLTTKETGIMYTFTEKLRACYSLEDFFDAFSSLEEQGDCSVLYIEREKNYVLYNSPNRLTCSEKTMFTLNLNFSEFRADGIYFIDKDFGFTSDRRSRRGFFMVNGSFQLFIFCKYTYMFDEIMEEGYELPEPDFPFPRHISEKHCSGCHCRRNMRFYRLRCVRGRC